MKKSITFLFAVLIVSVTMLSSCKKDDAESLKSTLMKYKWEMTKVETDDALTQATYDLMFALLTPTYEFKADDVYVVTFTSLLGTAEPEEGTWSISDDGKQLTIDGTTAEIVELTKEALVIKGSDVMVSGEESTTAVDVTITFEAK